ncbi:MAG: hypothetical protein P8P88_04550 [Polaribacter sp.]|nr:hypothetical protein [Polaribacter sp.]
MEDKILESIAYILPAAVTGFVAYYMFNGFLNHQNNQKKIELIAIRKKESLPTKLQAYERMLLFCERITPVKMLMRIQPLSKNTNEYVQLLIANIEQEFEHNLVQQLYISDEAWNSVLSVKKLIIDEIKIIAQNSDSINEFREKIILNSSNSESKIQIINSILKKEVKKLI